MSIGGKSLRRLKWAAFACLGMLTAGCSTPDSKSFTLKTNLPADFRIIIDVYYSPATGATCTMPPTTRRYIPGRKRMKSEMQNIAHSVEFDIPLSDTAGGCPLVLRSVGYDIHGKWGPDADDISRDIAGISFVDTPDSKSTTDKTLKLYNGECQWHFRIVGPEHYIIKLLKCRAIDDNDRVLKQLAGGALERDLLEGKTVSIDFTIAKKEMPAFGDSWIEFTSGWKRCLGKSVDDLYAFCNGNNKDFKSFKMPDGRTCSVYPNCTE